MTNRAKRYSTRAASIAIGTVALGLLIWAIMAFAAGTVTTDKSTYGLTNTITSTLAGGIANAPYRAEYWSPKVDNFNNATSVMRCYTSAPITSNGSGGATHQFTTSASNKQGTYWSARYAYNPNYKYPHYVAFDTGTTVFLGNNKQILYRFHLVDRNGVTITQDHSSDIVLTLYSSNVAKTGWTNVNPTTGNGWTFTSANGQYSRRDTIAKHRSNTVSRIMRLEVGGATTSGFMLNGTTAESGDTAAANSAARYVNHVVRVQAASTTAYPYKINPVYPLNTSPGSRNEIFVAGGTANYAYNYTYDVVGGNGSNLTSTNSQNITATAYPMWSGGTAATGTTTYTGGHFVSVFNLTTPGKYAIYIKFVRGTNTASLWQIVNYVACSSYFTMGPAPTPPANPSPFTATPADRKVNFSWTNPANPSPGTLKGIIICRKLDSNPFDPPVDGTSYNVGGVIQATPGSSGASTVVYKQDPATPNASGQAWTDGDSCNINNMLTTGGNYYYKVFAYDSGYTYSSGTSTGSVSPYDTTPPGVVTARSTGATGEINGVAPLDRANVISWTPPSDCDYKGVIIYASTVGWPTSSTGADGSRLVNVNDLGSYTENTWTDTSLNNGTQVYYSIWSKDDDGNVNSTPVHFGPMAPRDTVAPGQVSGSAAPTITAPTVIAHDAFTATLQWYAPADSGYDAATGNATAYEIRYVADTDPVNHPFPITDANWSKAFLPGGASVPSPESKGTIQTYKIEGLSPNHNYYFAIRARDEVFNWSVTSVNATVTTDCNAELTQCNQCHQMPPTDGLPGEHPRSVGNIGAHYLPIHTGGGEAKQCNVCHANGQVYDEVNNKLIYQYNHQNDVININYSGLIGNKLWRDNGTGGKFVGYTVIVHKNQHTGYSTAVGYKQLTGYCVNTYCHGQGAGASASPIWGMESVTCGQICHETPPATGKHVKHYHPGKYYINEAPLNHTPVSGYTNDTSISFWSPSNLVSTSTVDRGDDMNQGGNADPRYATYIASSNAVRRLPGLSQNTTYYVTVCVGDSAGALTNQYVALSNSSSGPWTTILSGDTADTRLFKKTVDYPFLVTGGDLYMKIGDGSTPTKLNFFIVNVSPEAPTTNNTVLANTTDEYGFACGKCHYTSANQLEKHTNHVGGPYKYTINGNDIDRTRDAEIAFDANSNPKNPVTSNYTAIFGTATSYMDGQRFFYTLGSQCQNLYCHGNTLDAGGTNTKPRWTGGYIDEQGSSICGSCHAANYKAAPSEQVNRNMTTGTHTKHVTNAYPYAFNCSKCHNGTVNPRAADGSVSLKDKTHHVNGVVEVIFDPNDPTMKLGHYSAISTPKYGYCINVYCHSNGLLNSSNQPFGATRYAMPQWSVSRNVPCDFCHGGGSVDGTPLYFSSASTFNSHPTHTKVNGIKCGICHDRTVGYNGQAIIQRNNTTFHVNGLIDVYFNYSVVKVSGGSNPSYSRGTRQCANTYCHGTAVPTWGGTIACGSCHATPPNYGRHDIHSKGNYGNLTTGNTINANKSLGNNYDFDCRFCHYQRSHGTGAVSDAQSAEVNFNPIDVQNGYNNTGGAYTPGLTGTPDSKGWNYTAGTCSVKCHSDGKGGPPNVTSYTWTSAVGSLGCFGCHGGVVGETPEINTGRHLAHIDDAPYAFTCDNCHYDTAGGNSVTHAEKHVNGTVDVAIKGGGTYSGSTCSGTYCHSNGNPGFDRGSANYFATSPVWSGGQMTCTTCHSDNHYDGAGDGIRSSGQTLTYNHQKHLGNYTGSNAGYGSRIGCATCHNKTASSNSSIQVTGITHVNGVKDIVFWTASTAGTSPRRPFMNMTGPDSALALTGIWGAVDNPVPGADLSCTVLCHSDGKGNPPNVMPNWSTAQGTYGCSSCHGYATSGFNNMTSGSHKKHVAGGSNYACGTCHRLTASGAFGAAFINRSGFLSHHVDGNVDVKMALSQGGTYDSGTKVCSNTTCHGASSPVWGTGTTTCLSCHASPPRNVQHFGHYSATAGGQTVTANNTVNGSTATVYQFGCGKCHLTPPANHLGGPIKSNQTAEVSFDAGTNPMNPLGSYTTANLRLYTSSTFRESKGLCRNLYCHSNGKATPAYAFINWSTKKASVTCTTCHGGAAAFNNMTAQRLAPSLTNPHARHAATDSYGFTCDKCHKLTASSSTAVSYKNNHVNGVKDVYLAVQASAFSTQTGMYSSGLKTCRNTYCHSDGNGGTGVTVTWAIASLTCTSCHNGNAASGSPITTGKHTAHVNNADTNITKYGCIRCHTKTVSGDTALLASKAYHVNGAKDVYFQAFNSTTGFYVSSTKACRNNYCHSSGQRTSLGNYSAVTFRVTTGWSKAWTANCNSCHGADSAFTAINGSPNYANRSTASRMWFNGHNVPGHVSSANDCIHCHMGTVNSFGNLTTGTAYHLDGTIRVNFQGGGTYTNKRCTGTVCHGSTTVRWGGQPLNCNSCHSDMGAGYKNTPHYFTGKHQKHTNQTTYRYACELCHATKNASGNIGHATGNVSTNQAAEVVFQSSTTMWRNFTYKNVTTFRYIRMNYLPGTATLTNIGAYQPGAYLAGADNPDTLNTNLRWTYGRCTNVWCHSNGQGTPTYNTYPNWSSAETATCTTCHGGKTSNTLSGKHQQHVNNGNLGNYGCVQCHKLTVSSDSAISSYGNHVNGVRNVSFNTLGGYTGFYTASQTCRNNYCHSSGQEASGTLPNISTPVFRTTPSWTGAALDCKGCHGADSGFTSQFGEPNYANRSTASQAFFNGHYVSGHIAIQADCFKCHANVVSSDGITILANGKHIDGFRNISFGAAGLLGGKYDAANKRCSNTASGCHGASVMRWGGSGSCQTCHGTTSTETDDFVYGNSTKATINMNEYTSVGHGKIGTYRYSGSVGASNSSKGARRVTACETCHDSTVAHNNYTSTGNYFRLRGGGDPNVLCTTALGCHSVSTTAHHNQANTAGDATWVFTPKCTDCHEPHGDMGPNGRYNNYMIQKLVNYSSASHSANGVPAGTNGSLRKGVNFPANAQLPVSLNWSSFATTTQNGGAYTGLCQVCHTRKADGTSVTGVAPGNFSRNQYNRGHNYGASCAGCHTHDTGFKGAGDCTGCHGTGGSGTGPTKRRDMQKEFVNSSSHHIVGSTWGTGITKYDCSACHAEGDYATGATTSWHRGVAGWPVYLKKWTSAVSGSGTFTVISTSRSGDAHATVTSQLSRNSTLLTPFCLGCHSDQNNATAPFTDGRTPTAYAWDNNSIGSRYSNNSTTAWGKFNSASYNVVPADMVTKAFSPHGNAGKNDSVMSITSFSIYSSTKAVQCYDCHNAHASNVGRGSSYTSGNGDNNGGIFISWTTPGGAIKSRTDYNKRYQPRKSGSTSTKNEAASSSSLCFDCHYGDAGADVPKIYTDYGLPAGKSIAGSYYDRVGNTRVWSNWSTSRWSTNDTWRGSFAYKDAKFAGGHFGRSTPTGSPVLQVNNLGTKINDGFGGKCVKCHDPHGTSPAIKRGYTKPVNTVDSGTGADPVLSGSYTGTANASVIYVIQIVAGGAKGTATYRASTDGGKTWGTTTNTNTDYVSNGITATFGAGTYAVDDTWTWLAGANPDYMVPALKGTWMHSPYKEDRAPRSTYTSDLGPASANTARLAGIQRADDFVTYNPTLGTRRLWDDTAGGTSSAGTTRQVGGPAPRGNPDFKTGSYVPGYNTPAVQGDGFGVGPYRLYGNAQVPTANGFTNVTSYRGWNGYYIDENTFGTSILKPAMGTVPTATSMASVNPGATPGNFAGLCLECHVWAKNGTALALGNITSANLGTGLTRITVKPHEAVSSLGSITVNLFRRAETWTGSAWSTGGTSQQPQYEMHGMNMTGQNHSDGINKGPGGTVVNSSTWGANDPTANSATSTGGHYYRWGVPTGQRTAGTVTATYHQFPCSKCHTPHVSRLPRLMKTNCLDNDNVGTPHTDMAYVTNGTTADTTSTKLWGNTFRNVACHSTKVGGTSNTGGAYVPGGWNNHTPW